MSRAAFLLTLTLLTGTIAATVDGLYSTYRSTQLRLPEKPADAYYEQAVDCYTDEILNTRAFDEMTDDVPYAIEILRRLTQGGGT